MLSLFVIPVVIWGGVAIVGLGKYVYKNFVFTFFSYKLTPQHLKQLAVVGSGRLECVFCLRKRYSRHVFYVSYSFKICPICRKLF